MFSLTSLLFAFLSIDLLGVFAIEWTFTEHVPLPTTLNISTMGIVRLDSSNHQVFIKADQALVEALYLIDNSVRFLTHNQELPFLWLVVASHHTVPSTFDWIQNGWTTRISIEDDKGKEQDSIQVALVLGWGNQMGGGLPSPASYGKYNGSQVYCKVGPVITKNWDSPNWITPQCGSFLQHTT
ncbi:hypothetical protein BCR37DRAFT_280202 [Protomyces lactucae-debilis]|uniref:Uncharacterized protein n=1 Tax=Protomyces lactucae-debilis TaxID=2754530 RepID=A0A1Y2FIM7_PROLT|nr:uncharacterized protein BCR37DRAFT_280202 [Protomyces lactucae-debilis]ORY83800.1 hypothetical protein BCR37DRAFT_280202 [Protomyces lactucae-debilis]